VLRAVLDAEDAIEGATSAGDVDQSKPAPDLVQVALGKAGVGPERAVFIGDTVWDVQACQRAGVPCSWMREPRRCSPGRPICSSQWGTPRRGSPSAARQLTTPPAAEVCLRHQ
jgi:beta-phosphoglucomutase-like phosphatase (HAD superfamily)